MPYPRIPAKNKHELLSFNPSSSSSSSSKDLSSNNPNSDDLIQSIRNLVKQAPPQQQKPKKIAAIYTYDDGILCNGSTNNGKDRGTIPPPSRTLGIVGRVRLSSLFGDDNDGSDAILPPIPSSIQSSSSIPRTIGTWMTIGVKRADGRYGDDLIKMGGENKGRSDLNNSNSFRDFVSGLRLQTEKDDRNSNQSQTKERIGALISCDSRGRFGVVIPNKDDHDEASGYYAKMFLGTFVNGGKKGTNPRNGTHGTITAPRTKQANQGGSLGILGKFVNAQKKTNKDIIVVSSVRGGGGGVQHPSSSSNPIRKEQMLTKGEVINSFRQNIERKILDFQSTVSQHELRIPLSLANYTKQMNEAEKSTIEMKILTFLVYEQVEEVDESLIACKEQSEFVDETVIVVYKEGHVPPDVLERLNEGDLPDEEKQSRNALSVAKTRLAEKKNRTDQEVRLRQALNSGASKVTDDIDGGDGDGDGGMHDVVTLNLNKRDRRSTEQIQMDMRKRKR